MTRPRSTTGTRPRTCSRSPDPPGRPSGPVGNNVRARGPRRRPHTRVRPPHPAPRPAPHGRPGAVARRRLGLPVGARRRTGRSLGDVARARTLGAARPPGRHRALRPTLVHQRPVPVPDRPAARPGREPGGRVPADLRSPRLGHRGRAAARRRRRVRVPGGAQRRGGRGRQGEPARPGVRRHRAPDSGAQRARRAGAPVVVDELRRGSGPVVAAGDLPRRHAARPPARRPGRRVAAHRLGGRPRDGRPGDHRHLPRHDRDPGAGDRAAVRLGRGRDARSTSGGSSRGRPRRPGSTTPP